MKYIILLSLLSSSLFAASAGYIWDGANFDIEGYMLVQDSDREYDFYWLPKKYKIKSDLDGPKATYSSSVINNSEYGLFTFGLKLAKPSRRLLVKAGSKLKNRFGYEAKIVGMLNICGQKLNLPSIASHSNSLDKLGTTYYFDMQESTDCSSLGGQKSINLTIQTPISQVEYIKNALGRGLSFPLPSITLFHPAKYKDEVSIEVDAVHAWENLNAQGGVSGSIKKIGINLKGKMNKMIERLSLMGKVEFNIRERDPTRRETIRKYYMDIFTDVMTKFFYSYSEVQTPTSDPLAMGEGADTNIFNASLAVTKEQMEKTKNIKLDLSNFVYSSIKSYATIDLSKAKNIKWEK